MRAMVLERPGEPLVEAELPDPSRRPARWSSGSRPAASAAPTSTSSTASCPSRSCRSSPATRSSARSRPRARAPSASRSGERVGVPWLGWTCGECRYCLSGRENLCERAVFTGYTADGGYAELVAADERYCVAVPDALRGRRGGAAALRRADRLPGAAHDRGRRAARPLRVRLLGAPRLPGRPATGPARLRLHQGRRRGGPGLRARARRGVGRRLRRRAARGARRARSSSLRSGRWCRPRCARWRPAAPSSAPGST